jgi:hypothetical protein
MTIFDPTTFTGIHTDVSVIAIVLGMVTVIALSRGQLVDGWTIGFLVTAVLTSATGYGFTSTRVLPSHIVGAIALIVLAITILARYGFHLAGRWRTIYPVGVVSSLYFLIFVAIAQAFAKIAALHSLAPTQSEPPFAIAQLVNLVIFVVIGLVAMRGFRR